MAIDYRYGYKEGFLDALEMMEKAASALNGVNAWEYMRELKRAVDNADAMDVDAVIYTFETGNANASLSLELPPNAYTPRSDVKCPHCGKSTSIAYLRLTWTSEVKTEWQCGHCATVFRV